MALLFADGFDSYAATADLTKKWDGNSNTSNVTWGAAAGRFGAGGLQLSGTGQLSKAVPQSTTWPIQFAFWLKLAAVPSSNFSFFSWSPAGNLGVFLVDT